MIGEEGLYYDLDHLMNRNGAFLDPDMFAPSPDVWISPFYCDLLAQRISLKFPKDTRNW